MLTVILWLVSIYFAIGLGHAYTLYIFSEVLREENFKGWQPVTPDEAMIAVFIWPYFLVA